MSEHPILFSAPMVRAILDGRKTQTRRVVKGLPAGTTLATLDDWLWVRESAWLYGAMGRRKELTDAGIKERWSFVEGESRRAMYFDAPPSRDEMFKRGAGDGRFGFVRRPSIHMPRWASRITLEVTSVRVERLQDITADDVAAEGVEIDWERVARMQAMSGVDPLNNVRASFAALWDSINSKRAPWASNPWVWRAEFRRVPPEVERQGRGQLR